MWAETCHFLQQTDHQHTHSELIVWYTKEQLFKRYSPESTIKIQNVAEETEQPTDNSYK